MAEDLEHLRQPLSAVARRDAASLGQGITVQEALEVIRRVGVGEKIVYFYAVDAEGKLTGVVPTRRLLTASKDQRIAEIMISRVLSLPATATVLEACEAFVMHRFLAFPVVDEEGRLVGVVDVGLLTAEAFDLAERERTDQVFESLGLRLSQVREASPVGAFRFRFPWLLATIGSGTMCALLASRFEATLARSLVLTFFMTLVLGLAESVSIQSMTVAIQSLRGMKPSWSWYLGVFRREAGTAVLLGSACGLLVGGIVEVWRGAGLAAVAIGASVALALGAACFFGITVPTLLHGLRLDPKIAAGPVTLALTDITTLLSYLGVAAWLL